MSDADWLNAIAKHRERWEEKRSMDLVGGAAELANVLQMVAQEQPERFARLGLDFPQDTLETYVEHLLIGLAQPDGEAAPASLQSIVALCRHVAHWSDTPCARWLPRLLAKYAEEPIPEDLLELVAQIATENPDPREDVWKIDAGGGQPYYGGDILGAGMNSARGAAALAIADLVVVDEGRVAVLGPAITKSCGDPLASVKACAAQAAYALTRWRREEAIEDLLVLATGQIACSRPPRCSADDGRDRDSLGAWRGRSSSACWRARSRRPATPAARSRASPGWTRPTPVTC